MKRILVSALLALSSLAFGATLAPVQLLNPAGSSAGQAIVSTGPSSAPGWSNVIASGLVAQAANTVLANATGSTATPTAFAMPSCIASDNALRWAPGSGFTCANAIALKSSGLNQFAATTSAQLAGVISDETGTGALVFGTNPTLGAMVATGQVSLGGTAGAEALRAVTTASAVNWLQVQGATTGNGPILYAQGADTNISMGINAKGSGSLFMNTGGGPQVIIANTANAVNWLQLTGSPTNNGATISAQGSDTNINLNANAKGTGAIVMNTGGGTQVVIPSTAGATRYLTLTGSNGGNPTIGASAGSVAFGSNVVVQGGTIDNTTIGGSTPAAGTFTTLKGNSLAKVYATNTSAQSIANNAATTVTGWTTTFDANSNFNASTGTFTAPASAYYQVCSQTAYGTMTGGGGVGIATEIFGNGVQLASGYAPYPTTSTFGVIPAAVCSLVSLTSGQTVVIKAYQNSGGAVALANNANANYLSIVQVP